MASEPMTRTPTETMLLEALEAVEVLLCGYEDALSGDMDDAALAKLHNATAETVRRAIATAKGEGRT